MIKKIISILLVLSMLVCFINFSGCEEKNLSKKSNNVLLNGFETFQEFLEFDYDGKYSSYSTFYGDISVNKDATYITEGKGSMKYEVADLETYPDKYMKSTFLIPTKHGEVDCLNFGEISKITMDVYNSSNTQIDLRLCPANILGKSFSKQQRYFATNTDYVLAENSWTEIVYEIDARALDLTFDISNVGYIALTFGGVNPVVYIDNLQAYKAEETFTPTEMRLDKNEVCSFDKDYQQLMAFSYGGEEVNVLTEINTDRNYSVSGNSLKVTIPANTLTSGYVSFRLSDKLMKKVSLGSYEDGAKFAFDVMKAYDAEQWIIPSFKNSYYGSYTNVPHVSIPAGQEWSTIEILISSVCYNPDGFEITFPVAGRTDRVLYFDDFRIIP